MQLCMLQHYKQGQNYHYTFIYTFSKYLSKVRVSNKLGREYLRLLNIYVILPTLTQ